MGEEGYWWGHGKILPPSHLFDFAPPPPPSILPESPGHRMVIMDIQSATSRKRPKNSSQVDCIFQQRHNVTSCHIKIYLLISFLFFMHLYKLVVFGQNPSTCIQYSSWCKKVTVHNKEFLNAIDRGEDQWGPKSEPARKPSIHGAGETHCIWNILLYKLK